MLDGLHTSCREAASVADPIDLVDDGGGHVAREQKIRVQRVRGAALHRARRRHQRLSDDLAAKDALSAQIAGLTAEEIHLERLEIELADQVGESGVHRNIVLR